MGILGMWTADLQSSNLPGHLEDMFLSTNYARTGTYSFGISNGDRNDWSFTQGVNEFYFRAAKLHTTSWTGSVFYCIEPGYTTNAYTQCLIWLSPTEIRFYTGTSTLVDSVAISASILEWYVLEAHIIIHNTTGVAQIKWNGQLVLDLNNIDTQNRTSDEVQTIEYYNVGSYGYLDDIMARDDQWCGAGGLYVLVPNSGSATEDWVASSGNPEDCVDEIPVSYTDYVSTEAITADTEHLFNVESLPITADSIGGVGVFVNSQADYTVDANVRTVLKSGGTQEVGSGILLSTSPSWQVSYWDQNPDDAADWETADIDALEIGVETN